ncbi:PTS sugar transporter subunit IIB [Tepidanaerobacter sp. EBM-49]|uniref:PTS sugar transporter subunit IIB n=1 Tax=Tepidanaerobacter sp. EBM-49 TaxID=1918504 RepID=UPI00257AC0B6|nr:PTS sugar transporter subunit IIB [Tepidanaerobacter sp. EBM-49]
MLKIVTICGCGMGSSVILKINTEKILKELKVPAKVEVSDVTTGKGAAREADLIIIGKELANLVKDINKPVIVLDSFVDKREISEKLKQYLKSANILEEKS